MTLEQFIKERGRVDKASDKLVAEMTDLQKRVSERLAETLSELEMSSGRFVASEANINRLVSIVSEMERAFPDPQWQKAVAQYLKTYDVLDAAVIGYVGEFGLIDAAITTALRKQFKLLAADYLLNAQSFQLTLGNTIAQEVAASIANGGSYRELISSVNTIIQGSPDKDGALVGDGTTAVNDMVSIYERTATQIASDAVGAEFYWYQGRPIDSTRPFCRSRANKYYHKKEVESWGNLEPWQGQIPGTNSRTIFSLLGGYNCRHALVPVARRDVPAEDLARMKSKGYIS